MNAIHSVNYVYFMMSAPMLRFGPSLSYSYRK